MTIPLARYRALLGTYLAPQWRRAVPLALALFTGIGLQLWGPQILRSFIDTARGGESAGALTRMAVLFLCVGVGNQLASALATYLGAQVGWTATNRLREDLAEHCLRLDMSFHNDRTPGQMIERVDGDVTSLSNFFSQFVIQVIGGLILAVGILVLLYRENLWVGMAFTLFAAIAFVLLLRFRDLAVPAARATREASSRLFGFLEEKLAGLEDLRANAGGPYVLDRFYRVNHRFFHASRKSWMMHVVLFMVIMGLFAVGLALSLGLGVFFYRRGTVTLGTVFLFIHYVEMLRGPLEQITRQFQDLQNATAGIARIDELLQNKERMPDGEVAQLPAKAVDVVFDRVTFAYREGEPILKDLSFRVGAGTSLGLIGRTGSGKTTIARLLFRLYEPQHGRVEVGGVGLHNYQLSALRGAVGMVTQDVQIFDASVRDNLTLFQEDISDERIFEVIDELGLRSWYERMPQRLDTPLESGATNLSAGEAQLLAFTRIFLRDPAVVVLDEPSSRMDPVTERLVKHSITRLLKNRTAVIIAHRLSTLQMVDDILLLEEGRAVEYGAREALAADPKSRFHRLLEVGMGSDML